MRDIFNYSFPTISLGIFEEDKRKRKEKENCDSHSTG